MRWSIVLIQTPEHYTGKPPALQMLDHYGFAVVEAGTIEAPVESAQRVAADIRDMTQETQCADV